MSNIIYRLTKGSPLTNEEVDGNFRHLNDKVENLGDVANLNTTNEEGKFLSASGEWEHIPKYSLATQSEDGLLSAMDKVKLDGLEAHPLLRDLGVSLNVVYSEPITIGSGWEFSEDGIIWKQGDVPADTPIYIKQMNLSTEVFGAASYHLISKILYWGDRLTRLSYIGGSALVEVPDQLPLNIINLRNMFWGATNFNQDISNWDTENVQAMDNMFENASAFNQDLSSWFAGNATMRNFAKGAGFENEPEKHPTTDSPIIFKYNDEGEVITYVAHPKARGNKFYQKDGMWFYVVEKGFELQYSDPQFEPFVVADGDYAEFPITDRYGITKIIPLNQVVTSKVTTMYWMFAELTNFNQDISKWDTSSVEDMGTAFYGASSFNRDISNWDTSSCKKMGQMFYGASSFNQDISNWNTKSLGTNTWSSPPDEMFYGASSFDQDLSGWCVSNVTREPYNFATNAHPNFANNPARQPQWGTCPRGEDQE